MDLYTLSFYLLIAAFALSVWAQFKVNGTFKRYSKVYAQTGMTGAQVARRILDANGLQHIDIQPVKGSLTDHYHPNKKTVFLSETVYNVSSIAAVSVAAHECGHAIQHAQNYVPLNVRSSLVPLCNIGNYGYFIFILLGIIMSLPSLVNIGIILFSLIVIFQLVTLPVEFNASSRALVQLENLGILSRNEVGSGKKVLTAAAWTYVAATIVAVMQLLRLILIFGNRE